ncbi:hypothetical protein EST38_g2977 [Candolleomyces aberdarensis]|uniref:Glycoside hydrolase family 71 protein n=1 Tax=Candolleomyces aberdarensis TaxID=2316362 RepID=A0A4Q2DU77_9AGAR|nr:hypothetical protein EST38_g2977 [Candolleomyces aberdarensis]
MQSLALALYFLAVFTGLVNALAIPIRRISIPTSERPVISVGKRHYEARQESSTTSTSIIFEPSGFVVTLRPKPTETASTTTTSTTSTSTATSTTSTSTSTTPTSSQQPQQTPPADGSKKWVVAHHMVGNTFPYKKEDWLEDVKLAHESGIDGFALNTGRDEWEPDRIADAYQAALESKLDFKLFLSLDMASLPCNSAENAQYLRKLVLAHVDHPNQLKYDNRAFVSTFAGENCQFGQGGVEYAWKTQFTQHPELQGKIYFVPSFFIDPARFGSFNGVMDGDFNWNSGWPIKVTTNFAKDLLNEVANRVKEESQRGGLLRKPLNQVLSTASAGGDSAEAELQEALSKFIGSTDTDTEHLNALKALSASLGKRDGEEVKPVYMAAVSPWFFTHYGANSFNKNFIFLSDQHLYSKRWESIINSRDQLDIVQVLTWNDYGESHYIGPIKGDQPDSESWTDGMDHTAWLGLTKYYATAFKTGQFPTIEKDQIYMWSRPHSATAQSPDPVPQPTNFELTEDAVWAVVLTTAPAKVTLTTSNNPDANSQKTFDVPAGVSKLSIPITPGGIMKGVIERDGKVVVELAPTPEQFTFQGSPKNYNFNAFVASAVAN